MTFEQESGRLFSAGAAEPTAQAAIVCRLRGVDTGPLVQRSKHRTEAIEPDESYAPVTQASTVIALASLFVAIEAFLDRNCPGLTLSDLRAVAASESGLHETSRQENGRE